LRSIYSTKTRNPGRSTGCGASPTPSTVLQSDRQTDYSNLYLGQRSGQLATCLDTTPFLGHSGCCSGGTGESHLSSCNRFILLAILCACYFLWSGCRRTGTFLSPNGYRLLACQVLWWTRNFPAAMLYLALRTGAARHTQQTPGTDPWRRKDSQFRVKSVRNRPHGYCHCRSASFEQRQGHRYHPFSRGDIGGTCRYRLSSNQKVSLLSRSVHLL